MSNAAMSRAATNSGHEAARALRRVERARLSEYLINAVSAWRQKHHERWSRHFPTNVLRWGSGNATSI